MSDKISYRNIESVISPYIEKGETLKEISIQIGVKYSYLKKMTRKAGIVFPSPEELRNKRCLYLYGLSFREYLILRKEENRSNRYIARELGIQACTLYILADKYDVDIRNKKYNLDDQAKENIRAANISRFQTSVSAHLITFQGVTKTISAWSRDLGFKRGVLNTRIIKLGWSINDAMMLPSGHKLKVKRVAADKSRLVSKKSETPKAPRVSETQLKLRSIADQFLLHPTQPSEGVWYMVRVVSTSAKLIDYLAEELESKTLYLGEKGEPVSLDKAAIVSSEMIAKAFISCMPFYGERKLTDSLLTVEKFRGNLGEYGKLDVTSAWLDKMGALFEKKGVHLINSGVLSKN